MQTTDGALSYSFGPNDSGLKRGDLADTGDNQAGIPDDIGRSGSGPSDSSSGHTTGLPDSDGLAETEDGLTIVDGDDPSLGLTDKEDYY